MWLYIFVKIDKIDRNKVIKSKCRFIYICMGVLSWFMDIIVLMLLVLLVIFILFGIVLFEG